MKKITGILCLLLCGLSAMLRAQTEAVGINTENPKGVLHIDAAANNPPAGEVSATEAADDVVISADGQLGLGLLAPATKVDVEAGTTGAALRIADGTQGEGKALASVDEYGTGQWTTVTGGVWWYAALYRSDTLDYTTSTAGLRPYVGYTDPLISAPGQGEADVQTGTIRVPSDGRYRVTLGIHYMSNRTTESSPSYWAKSTLLVNGSSRWTPSAWAIQGTRYWGTLPTFMTILNLEADDVLSLSLMQADATYSANRSCVWLFIVELLQLIQP